MPYLRQYCLSACLAECLMYLCCYIYFYTCIVYIYKIHIFIVGLQCNKGKKMWSTCLVPQCRLLIEVDCLWVSPIATKLRPMWPPKFAGDSSRFKMLCCLFPTMFPHFLGAIVESMKWFILSSLSIVLSILLCSWHAFTVLGCWRHRPFV